MERKYSVKQAGAGRFSQSIGCNSVRGEKMSRIDDLCFVGQEENYDDDDWAFKFAFILL